MKRLLILAVPAVFVFAACGGGSGTDAKVDEIMTEVERLDISDAEVDEMRASIDEALNVLPDGEEQDYLDTLLESVKDMADAADNL